MLEEKSEPRIVIWTDEESTSVIDWLKERGHTGNNLTGEAIRKAQEAVLPSSRQRAWTTPTMMKPAFLAALDATRDQRNMKVRWTREEFGLVAARLVQLGADPRARNYRSLVRQVQREVLPERRWMTLHALPPGLADAYTVAKRAHTRALNAEQKVHVTATSSVPSEVPPVVAVSNVEEVSENRDTSPPSTALAPEPAAVSPALAMAAASLVPRALGYLERFLVALERGAAALDTMAKVQERRAAREGMQANVATIPLAEPVLGKDTFIVSEGIPPPPPTPRKKHVLLIAANPDQLNHVQKAFPDWSIQRHHTGNGKDLPEKARGADVVIQMTKFSTHTYDAAIKKGDFKHKLKRVNGAATDVVKILRLWDAERRAN